MLQAKLLRVLEDQTFRRLGGLKDIHLDLRVVAATNKNLREAVKEGAFRQDLYFRLNVIQILIPPLRERPEDIVPLTQFFIEHYNRKFKRSIEGVSDGAAKLLLAHDWPGNVRELRNAIERAMILEESALDHAGQPADRDLAAGAAAAAGGCCRSTGDSRPTACRSRTTSGACWRRRSRRPAATRRRPPACCASRATRCATR